MEQVFSEDSNRNSTPPILNKYQCTRLGQKSQVKITSFKWLCDCRNDKLPLIIVKRLVFEHMQGTTIISIQSGQSVG